MEGFVDCRVRTGPPACNDIATCGKQRIWGAKADRVMGKPKVWRYEKNAYHVSKPPLNRIKTIYRGCEGLPPYYTGHVPGEKYRVGKGYTAATRNADLVIRPRHYYPTC